MSKDPTDPSTTEFFGNATGFSIAQGRFRTVAGNAYTGCHPPESPSPPGQQVRPPNTTRSSYFTGASQFQITHAEFETVHGDSVDFPAHPSNIINVPTPTTGPQKHDNQKGYSKVDNVNVLVKSAGQQSIATEIQEQNADGKLVAKDADCQLA